MAKYFRFPFAVAGDRTDVPDATQADSTLSYQQGYSVNYELNQATDPNALDVERRLYNQSLFDVTSTLQQYFQRGVPPYITADDNGGVAYGYNQYARVLFNNRVYESLINNNTTTPTNTTNWRLVDFAGLDARYLTQTTGDARYIAGTLGTADGNIPQIGTPGTTTTGNRSAVVVRSGSNSNGNYRVWSDGLIIQWGLNTTSIGINATITSNFPISFNSVPIPPLVNATDSSSTSGSGSNLTAHTPTTTNFRVLNDNQTTTGFSWYCIGF